MIPALFLLAARPQSPPLNLFRGAAVVSPRYWDVEDTYLDSSAPESGFGGSYTLLGGKGKTILIRFGDLNRVVGPHRHVVKASLFLTPSGGDPPLLKSVSRVLQSWGEGPRTAISNLFTPPPKPGVKPPLPHWVATWKARKSGIAGWQAAGAGGADDRAMIASAHLDAADREFAIGGLEQAVQTMLDRPYENNGFAIDFSTSTEFFSSKAPSGRPRLEITTEDAPAAGTPDLSVISITSDPAAPRSGQEVTYTATIKNVGKSESAGFSGHWIVNEKQGESVEGKAVAPGASVTFTLRKRAEFSATDHRSSTLALRIEPSGPDADTANDCLSIDEGAAPVSVSASPELTARLSALNYVGSQSWEDWAQSQVALWNDTVAAQSRFSFAPEGALERVRINSFGGGVAIPGDSNPLEANVQLLKLLSIAAGTLDGTQQQIPSSMIRVSGSTTRSSLDPFAGITGYGDTRFDGTLPGALPLDYEPAYDPQMRDNYLEATDLLPGTDVAGLNKHLEVKASQPSDNLLPIPKAIILRVLDYQGTALPDTDMLFFQSSGGAIPSGNPVFAVKTNSQGIAILNTRGSGGPFGDLSASGDNGVFLVQAKTNGVLETGWLKAWQLAEEGLRGAVTCNLRLNLPMAPIDRSVDMALDKIVTDSLEEAPPKLAPLIDDSEDTSADLPDAKGAWVQVDLGRDRMVGEIDVVSTGKPFWQQFDLTTFGTGQRPQEGSLWARELNWPWTSRVRKDPAKTAAANVVAYRGAPQRVRYIRLINKSGGAGSLAEIRIFGARISN